MVLAALLQVQEVETVVKVCLVAQVIVEKALANLLIAAHVLVLLILPVVELVQVRQEQLNLA